MGGLIYVGIGGAIGAMARYGMGVVFSTLWSHPVVTPTLMINFLGSVCMGVICALVNHFDHWHDGVRLSFMVGLLGSFTTFSTFSLELILLMEEKAWGSAMAYMGASICLSVAGIFIALSLTRGLLS